MVRQKVVTNKLKSGTLTDHPLTPSRIGCCTVTITLPYDALGQMKCVGFATQQCMYAKAQDLHCLLLFNNYLMPLHTMVAMEMRLAKKLKGVPFRCLLQV